MLERNIHTYTIKEQLQLHKAKALILGCGGGGCVMAEVLCRTGVGNITLVDFDHFEDSNCNRQLGAMKSTLGLPKVDVLKKRLEDINPRCMVTAVNDRVCKDNYEMLFRGKDIILDACDKRANKEMIGEFARSLNQIYTTGGLGGYNFWCATLKDRSVKEILTGDDAHPVYPCASGVMAQGALQAQQGINVFLNRPFGIVDKAIKVNFLMYGMSVEDINNR